MLGDWLCVSHETIWRIACPVPPERRVPLRQSPCRRWPTAQILWHTIGSWLKTKTNPPKAWVRQHKEPSSLLRRCCSRPCSCPGWNHPFGARGLWESPCSWARSSLSCILWFGSFSGASAISPWCKPHASPHHIRLALLILSLRHSQEKHIFFTLLYWRRPLPLEMCAESVRTRPVP